MKSCTNCRWFSFEDNFAICKKGETQLSLCFNWEPIISVDLFDDIKKFHEKFKLSPIDKPGFLSREMMEFRVKFMQEELQELIDSYENNNLHDAFDALIDLTYVVLGTAYLMNLPFNDGWREVHHCNMQKIRAKIESESKRGSTYDVVKPEGWTPPDHSKILRGDK